MQNQNTPFGRTGDLRSPKQAKPVYFIVDAGGRIHRKEFAPHCGNGIDDLDKNGSLTSHAMREGKQLLQDLYAADPNPQVREKGFQLYCEYDKAGKEDNLPKETRVIRTMQDGTKHTRDFPRPFPTEWLPAEVVARREGRSELSKKQFAMPKLTKAKASAKDA